MFVDSIPKNPAGKILRRVLRQEHNIPNKWVILWDDDERYGTA